jgi:hypothetical protein
VLRRDDRFECEQRAPTPNPSPQREDALGRGAHRVRGSENSSTLVSRVSGAPLRKGYALHASGTPAASARDRTARGRGLIRDYTAVGGALFSSDL